MPIKYPNQKIIKIIKENCDCKHIYAMINIEAIKYAAQHLKPAAFKLWIYFAKNQPFYDLNLSSAAVLSEFNMKKDMYDTAVHELIDNGFLVLYKDKTFYHFYEIPLPENVPKVDKFQNEKKEITTRNNTILNDTNSVTKMPLQGTSSLPRDQTSSAPLDAGEGAKAPSRDKSIPFIYPMSLMRKLRDHDLYVKYLGNNVVQFPSGKKYKVIEGYNYDRIVVNYKGERLIDLRKAELAKKAEAAKAANPA